MRTAISFTSGLGHTRTHQQTYVVIHAVCHAHYLVFFWVKGEANGPLPYPTMACGFVQKLGCDNAKLTVSIFLSELHLYLDHCLTLQTHYNTYTPNHSRTPKSVPGDYKRKVKLGEA